MGSEMCIRDSFGTKLRIAEQLKEHDMRLMEVDQGCRGQQVQMLQHLLNTTGKVRPVLELDGVFGVRTDRAVRQYQAGRGLPADGIVGARTWRSLGAGPSSLPLPHVPAARAVGASMPTRSVPVAGIRNLPPPVEGKRAAPAAAAAGHRRAIVGPPALHAYPRPVAGDCGYLSLIHI